MAIKYHTNRYITRGYYNDIKIVYYLSLHDKNNEIDSVIISTNENPVMVMSLEYMKTEISRILIAFKKPLQ